MESDQVETTSSKSVTGLLIDWSRGDRSALDRLVPLVYDELRRLASQRLRRERSDNTIETTTLVHETYLRLVDQKVGWRNRAHFYGIAAQLMRRILVDRARRQRAAKRGGRVTIRVADLAALPIREEVDLAELDDALNGLAAVDARQSRIVELRFFGGLTIEDTAEVLGLSPATVKREWRIARAWLYHEMGQK